MKPAKAPPEPEVVPMTALELLQAVYRDEARDMKERLDAAKVAISYESPRLASVKHGADESAKLPTVIFTGVPMGDLGESEIL